MSYTQSDLSMYLTIDDSVCVSKMNQLTLQEYLNIRKYVCLHTHDSNCVKCPPMLAAADMILKESICSLSEIFKTFFPNITYNSHQAKQRLLQMPLATIRIGQPSSGNSVLYIMEFFQGLNYSNLRHILESTKFSTSPQHQLSKSEMQKLLLLASTTRERETLKYAVYKVSGLTPTAARKVGLDNMSKLAERAENAIEQITEIRRAFDEIIVARVHACTESSSSDSGEDADIFPISDEYTCSKETANKLDPILKQSLYNWFEFCHNATEVLEVPKDQADCVLNAYHSQLGTTFTEEERKQIDLSFEAYWADEMINEQRKRRFQQLCNGSVVTDSESEDPDAYQRALQTNCISEESDIITKKVNAIKRQVRRRRAKYIAEQHYLGRRKSKALHSIADKFPDIGSEIERYVSSCNVGADAWRRTGILTFDGNQKVNKKCTYRRIQEHLMSIYGPISYGTVVQLCVARNKRRLSAKRYRGLAQVTSRRARKGFQLRYNPDSHWSAALYRNLNILQYSNGSNILNINRDDQAGFRLDTLATHHQYSTPVVKGHDVLTTHTDYVNRYPSVLQTTSYNFSSTSNTDEYCAGVTKAQSLFIKCPAQHAADIQLLCEKEELRPAFFTAESVEKSIDCIRVDGAADEGPGHEEVQFYWTEWHVKHQKVATLVTSRSSGSSFMNRVELQNGCLTRAHSNLFIPSTLNGSCIKGNGKVDKSVLHKNLNCAIDIYIDRCNGCSCGKTVIHLFKGIRADYEKREKLIVFLKGTKKKKEQLKKASPTLYQYFSMIWNIRTRHMVPGLPSQYVFFLRCCLSKDCMHPLCSSLTKLPDWYAGGPPLTFFPLPVQDLSRPFGSSSCSECKEVCSGHYLTPDENFVNMQSSAVMPPSVVLGEQHKASGSCLSEKDIEDLARKVLLPVSEVKLWLQHLDEVSRNRREGAIKAAETRKQKKRKLEGRETVQEESETVLCKVCGGQWMEETDEVEQWIQCEVCMNWFHWECVCVSEEPETFYCGQCNV